jgi:hypothetical protein
LTREKKEAGRETMKDSFFGEGGLTRAAVAIVFGCMAVAMAPVQAAAQLLANVGHASAGYAQQISVAQLQPDWVVTASRNSSNNLEVIVWHWTTKPCSSGGTLTCNALIRMGSQVGGPVLCCFGGVAVARVNANRVATAVLNQSTKTFLPDLELTTWSVSTSVGPDFGTIAQEDHIASTTIQPASVSMTGLNGSQVVTAVLINPTLDLNLAAWAVSSTGTITAQGTAQSTVPVTGLSGLWSPAAITDTNSSEHNQVVTAYSTGKDVDLTLSSWNVSTAGTITLQQDASAGYAGPVSLTSWGSNASKNLAAAFVNGSNDIEVINWTVDPSTGVFTRQASGHSSGGSTPICAFRTCFVAATTFAKQIFIAADGTGGGKGAEKMDLSVMEWQDSAPKLFIVAQGDSGAGNELVAATPLDESHTVTASAHPKTLNLEMNVWSFGVK